MGDDLLLGDVFDIPEVISASDFVLELHKGVEKPAQTVAEYVVTDSLAKAFDEALGLVSLGLKSRQDRGVFLHGDFGSGKSHFMAVLDLLLRRDPRARAMPGLQAAVAKHEQALTASVLTVEYHLIGAESLEDRIFAGYLARVRQVHPDAQLPLLHKSDALFADAANRRKDDEAAFFAALNSGATADSGWGAMADRWSPQTYDRAVAAPVGDSERERLAADLVATMFTGYTSAGQWLDISDGLGVMTTHAKSLGYAGLVLFLDELVLWLASRLNDQKFVSEEGSKVAKLVETGIGQRDIPIISFVARQRELQDFYAESTRAEGAQTSAVGDTFRYWENRFDTIILKASNLPDIAHRRLLMPVDQRATDAVAQALATLKSNRSSWDALMRDEAQSDEVAFAKVYPFSPALVDTLVFLSGLLQRERTALKVMALLLCEGRNTARITQIIPVAALFDAIVLSGLQPLTESVRVQFENARRLYAERMRPVLLSTHGLQERDVAALEPTHAFFADDRLAKTLLLSALVNVPALKDLTASKLAALNHGSVSAFIPGTEAVAVLGKVRPWAQQIGELEVGDGADPVIKVVLAGVDYESVLNLVQSEDTPGARRNLLRRMVFEQFGIEDANRIGGVTPMSFVWRGTRRRLDVLFGNIRDANALPQDVFRAEGETWRLIVDYPFDEGNHVPHEDIDRFEDLRSESLESRTVGWVPRFLSAARQDDLGTLVLLEHLLGGAGDQFEANAQHLPADQRPMARTLLENKRKAAREKLESALKQAYGVAAIDPQDVDTSHGDFAMWPTLWPELDVRPPVGATLADAMLSLSDQMLSEQYPKHPMFEAEVRPADLAAVLEHVREAVDKPDGRIDPVENSARPRLRRVANPLQCGQMYENHYVFTSGTFPWRNEFVRLEGQPGDLTVKALRDALKPWGLTREAQSLLILSWALLQDKQFLQHGVSVRVHGLKDVTDGLVLADPQLPSDEQWASAQQRAAVLFGLQVPPLASAANLAVLGQGVRGKAQGWAAACARLQNALEARAQTLGLAQDSPRLVTARSAAVLVSQLAQDHDDLTTAVMLADAEMPEEAQALAKSISSADPVAKALESAQWSVLNAVAGMDTDKARACLADLRTAARLEELHAPLQPALGTATLEASQYLASNKPPQPAPTPSPTAQSVDDVALGDVDAVLGQLNSQIRTAMSEQPDKKLHLKWWLE